MEATKLEFDHSKETVIVRKVSRRKNKSSDGWVMSFADVVTVLLCFFIIFYMVEKQYKKNTGFGPNSGTVQEFRAKMSTPEVLSLIESMELLPQVSVVNKSQFLEVHFPPEMFFKSGSTKLTDQGVAVINRIIAPLTKIKGGYILQIQGYTDSSPVRDIKGRWWKNNMELSLERSLEVYDYMIANGVEKSILSVTGFGANKPLNTDDTNMQRRITVKFEPILEAGTK